MYIIHVTWHLITFQEWYQVTFRTARSASADSTNQIIEHWAALSVWNGETEFHWIAYVQFLPRCRHIMKHTHLCHWPGFDEFMEFSIHLKKSFPSTYWSKMLKNTVYNKEKIDRDCKIISNSIPFLTDSFILCDGEWEGGRDSWWYKKILHQQFLSVWLGRSSHSPGLVSRTGLVFVWISIG